MTTATCGDSRHPLAGAIGRYSRPHLAWSSGCFAQYCATQALLAGSTMALAQFGPGGGGGGTCPDPGPGGAAIRSRENCTFFFLPSTTSVLSLKPRALITTVRFSPLGTSRLSGPSNSLVPFSYTSKATPLRANIGTCTTSTGGGALLPASDPSCFSAEPEPASDPACAEPASAEPALPEPSCELFAEPEPSPATT